MSAPSKYGTCPDPDCGEELNRLGLCPVCDDGHPDLEPPPPRKLKTRPNVRTVTGQIQVETGIPIPKAHNRNTWPWHELVPGGSFPVKPAEGTSIQSVRSSLCSSFRRWKLRNDIDWNITTRAVVEGGVEVVRVWRI